MRVPLYITFFPPLVAFRILFIFNFCHFNYTLMWVSLGSSGVGCSVLLVPGYLFPSSGLGSFQL